LCNHDFNRPKKQGLVKDAALKIDLLHGVAQLTVTVGTAAPLGAAQHTAQSQGAAPRHKRCSRRPAASRDSQPAGAGSEHALHGEQMMDSDEGKATAKSVPLETT